MALDFQFRPQVCLGCPKHCEGHRLFTIPMFSWEVLLALQSAHIRLVGDFWQKKSKTSVAQSLRRASSFVLQSSPKEHVGDRARAEPSPADTCPTKLTESSKRIAH